MEGKKEPNAPDGSNKIMQGAGGKIDCRKLKNGFFDCSIQRLHIPEIN